MSALHAVFGLLDLASGRRALLLQAAERFQIALGSVAGRAGFYELYLNREHFFMRTSGVESTLVSLRGSYQRLGFRRLTTNVGVIELQQQLAFADVVALLHKQALDGGGYRGVGFEILHWLDFAIGRNEAADGSSLNLDRAHGHRSAARNENDQHDYRYAQQRPDPTRA